MKILRKNAMQQHCLVVLAIAFCVVLFACSEEPPMKIGFVGGMTGRVADLGIAGRDGVKKSLLELESYQGLQCRFKIDRFGDVEREFFLTVVDDGQFKVVD